MMNTYNERLWQLYKVDLGNNYSPEVALFNARAAMEHWIASVGIEEDTGELKMLRDENVALRRELTQCEANYDTLAAMYNKLKDGTDGASDSGTIV